MGRRQENVFRKFFKFNATTNESTCQIPDCNVIMKGNHGKNLERHIERNHYIEYEKCQEENQNTGKNKRGLEPDAGSAGSGSKVQRTLDGMITSTKRISIEMSYNTLWDACVELVTVNGRPFSYMEDSGFKQIVGPIITQLKLKGQKAINAENIRNGVIDKASKMRELISAEIKDKLVSFKIDGATRLDRSVLGINIQFVCDGHIHLRTLAIYEMKQRHTAEYLKEVILEVAKKYSITIDQIYTITTDNGANMLKAVKLVEGTPTVENSGTLITDDAVDMEAVEVGVVEQGTIAEDELVHLIEEGTALYISDRVDHDPVLIRGVRCAAHTLQLVVDDSLKSSNVSNVISRARRVCKKLRNPSMAAIIKKMKLKKPILDCPTRWHSTLDMIVRILELREFCEDMSASNTDLYLSNSDWESLDSLSKSLMPAKIATKLLQSEQLTMGDFYREWLTCSLETKKLNTAFTNLIVQNMKKRETVLFDNDSFLAAIFLDPRFQLLLNAEQKNRAIQHLTHTWFKMKSQVEGTDTSTALTITTIPIDVREEERELLSEDDELEVMLQTREASQVSVCREISQREIGPILTSFVDHPRINKKMNILEFWESKMLVMPELFSLSQVVHAVPATQVSVERLFSGLKYILSPLRNSLSSELLEDILLVRSNQIQLTKELKEIEK